MQTNKKLKKTIIIGSIASLSLMSLFSISPITHVKTAKNSTTLNSEKLELNSRSSEAEFEQVFRNIEFDYYGKEKTTVKLVDVRNVHYWNYDADLYDIEIRALSTIPQHDISIWVNYRLVNKKTGEKSIYSFKRIGGFISDAIHAKYVKVEEQLKNLKLEIKNKNDIYPNQLKIDDIEITGYDEDEIWTMVSKITFNKVDFNVEITVSAWLYEDSILEVTKTFTVDGFKDGSLTEKQFDEAAKNIKFDFPNKKETYVYSIQSEDRFTASEYDKSRLDYKFRIITLDATNSKVYLEYELVDKKTGKTSDLKLAIINGFKSNGSGTTEHQEPNEIIKLMILDVEKRTKVEDVDTSSFSNIFGYTVEIQNLVKRADNTVLVRFKLTKD